MINYYQPASNDQSYYALLSTPCGYILFRTQHTDTGMLHIPCFCTFRRQTCRDKVEEKFD